MNVLKSCIELIVPSTVHVNISADNMAWVQRVMEDFSRWFGGATMTEGEGCYCGTEGLVSEKVYQIRSYCTEQALITHGAAALALAQEMREALSQESVTLIVNNALYWVT